MAGFEEFLEVVSKHDEVLSVEDERRLRVKGNTLSFDFKLGQGREH